VHTQDTVKYIFLIITDESYKQKAILADQEALKKYNVWLEKFL